MGYNSLNANTTGSNNTAVGSITLFKNTTGANNIGLGYSSLYFNTTGYSNTAVGMNSLVNNNTGYENTAVGINSLFYNLTGFHNTALGLISLDQNTTGNNNTGIGFNAQVPDGTLNNQVRIGDTFVTYAGVQVAWTITSDRRWKSDIQDSKLSLSFINKLRPVSYFRNNDESQRTEYGFIAQEVEQVLKESGVENTGMITIDDNGMYELRYNDLLAPMVKAIQELNDKCEELKKENEQLKTVNEKLVKLERLVNELTAVKNVSLTQNK